MGKDANEMIGLVSRKVDCFPESCFTSVCGTRGLSDSIVFRSSLVARRWRARLVGFWRGELRICGMLGDMRDGDGFSSW